MQNTISILETNIRKEILLLFDKNGDIKGFDFIKGISSPIYLKTTNKSKKSLDFIRVDVKELDRIKNGNIYFLSKNKLRLMYDCDSHENVLFLTNECNNHCLMCSQPPSKNSDIDFYYSLNKNLIDIIPGEIAEIGITGGEPTLYGEKLLDIIELLYDKNPDIKIHILTNGRYFSNYSNANIFKDITTNVTWGIPIHSDYYKVHDEITGRESSYYETLTGIYNLARIGSSIELRIVVNKKNYTRLYELSEFIYKNMPFVKHVAFMGMEYFGLAIKNFKQLWIDPLDYNGELEKAVINLATWRLNVSIYNIPFCLLKPTLYEFAKISISSWKIMYVQECQFCDFRSVCGGLFGTSRFQSSNIRAIKL